MAACAWPAGQWGWTGRVDVAGVVGLILVVLVATLVGAWTSVGAHPTQRVANGRVAGAIAGALGGALVAVMSLQVWCARHVFEATSAEARLEGLAWLVGMGPWSAILDLAGGAVLGALLAGWGARLMPVDERARRDRARIDDWRLGVAA